MTQTLKQQVEALINAEGKMLKTAVYGRFELVAERRIVAGSAEVAPVRLGSRVLVDAPPAERALAHPKVDDEDALEDEMRARRAEAKQAVGGRTLREAIISQFEPGRVMSPEPIIAKLDCVWTAKSIRSEMSSLKAEGVLDNRPRRG